MPSNQRPSDQLGHYKVWFDPLLLVLAHILLLPLWLILWTILPLLIWVGDRGPVFYKQDRAGKDGRVITILKFRTMVPDADRIGPLSTTQDDPRVTRIGKLLRRTALDELPELISIFRGEMSFVGPRALGTEEHTELEQDIPSFRQRLQVLPGLTGLAQVYDHTDDAQNRFRYDIAYVGRMSPWLDVKLLILSVANTLGGRWDRRPSKSAQKSAQTRSSGAESQGSGPSSEGHANSGNRR